ncbi:hypothetical protein GGD67_002772 [Bradyrhizobium sp. IAR9]|nr:hypothetical protein [Bradyrhizobium sp. IAR9]
MITSHAAAAEVRSRAKGEQDCRNDAEPTDRILDTASYLEFARHTRCLLFGNRPATVSNLTICCKRDNYLDVSQQFSSTYLAQLMHWVTQVNPSSGAPQPLSLLAKTGSTFGRLVDAIPLRICARDASGAVERTLPLRFATAIAGSTSCCVTRDGATCRPKQARSAASSVRNCSKRTRWDRVRARLRHYSKLATRPNETWAMDVVLGSAGEAAFFSKTTGSIAGRRWGPLFISASAPILHFFSASECRGKERHRGHRAMGQNTVQSDRVPASEKQTDMRAEKST